MRVDEAAKILRNMYDDGLKNRAGTVSIHLFGIQYADQIKHLDKKEIIKSAGLYKSYNTELLQGIKLADYVRLK